MRQRAAKSIVTSPLVLRAALFFVLSIGILATLAFGIGFSTWRLLESAFVLLLLGAGLFFRALKNAPATLIQGPRVYDKAEYHYDGDFPKGLPRRQAFVHSGMFVGWLIEHDMIDAGFLEETRGFKERKITGAQVYKAWDGTLTSDALTEEGNAFATYYYNGTDGQSSPYLEDYEATLATDLPSLYHVEDTWENYDKIRQKIDQRFEAWKRQN